MQARMIGTTLALLLTAGSGAAQAGHDSEIRTRPVRRTVHTTPEADPATETALNAERYYKALAAFEALCDPLGLGEPEAVNEAIDNVRRAELAAERGRFKRASKLYCEAAIAVEGAVEEGLAAATTRMQDLRGRISGKESKLAEVRAREAQVRARSQQLIRSSRSQRRQVSRWTRFQRFARYTPSYGFYGNGWNVSNQRFESQRRQGMKLREEADRLAAKAEQIACRIFELRKEHKHLRKAVRAVRGPVGFQRPIPTPVIHRPTVRRPAIRQPVITQCPIG